VGDEVLLITLERFAGRARDAGARVGAGRFGGIHHGLYVLQRILGDFRLGAFLARTAWGRISWTVEGRTAFRQFVSRE
jgi:hypothetical protein